MKITKGRLKEIIKEELSRVNEDDLDLWSDDVPSELVKSWAQEIHKFIEAQWSADSDFSSVRAERPAIVAALQQVAKELGSAPEPEPYK